MESLQTLRRIDWYYYPYHIIPNKFPFTNDYIPLNYNPSSRWAKRYYNEGYDSRISQKKFVEYFFDITIVREISILDSNKQLQKYYIGAKMLFRKQNQIPIIITCNEGTFVSNNLTPFEKKMLDKLGIEYIVKDFIMEGLIEHFEFRFKTLKDKNEYLTHIDTKLKEYINR